MGYFAAVQGSLNGTHNKPSISKKYRYRVDLVTTGKLNDDFTTFINVSNSYGAPVTQSAV
jgi:hypothetical protein